ncbi:MAG: transcriptional repressor LexA [Planctomycetales bacterium]|nr:transcriptional repressor LexA [Planctomycetales bacterium]
MSPLDQLTPRQREIFDFIRDKIENRGYGPTVREIGDHFEIRSPNGVMCHLKALEKKGLITREANMSRAIQLTEECREEPGLPLVGQIAAGVMHEAIEQTERLDFDALFNKSKKSLFALKVKGESMIDAQIADGDYVIIRKQRTAHPGQMVVAQTEEGEATLKYWFPERNRIRLQPANSGMEPIYSRDARVQGVVVGVVRQVD